MSGESIVSKSSFFKDYFRHKMRGLKGFTITFAAMNFVLITVLAASVMIIENNYRKVLLPGEHGTDLYVVYNWMSATCLLLVFLAAVILVAVMAAINLKFYHNRSAMDTIGGLPLTTTQRFWGDFLSGAASFIISFIPCSVIGLIFMAITEFGIMPDIYNYFIEHGQTKEYMFPEFKDNFIIIGLIVILTVFLCFAAAYTISCFITSCSGRLNTAIVFSLVTPVAAPIIICSYGSFIFNEAVGVVETTEVALIANALPPFGTFYFLLWSYFSSLCANYTFAAAGPKIIVMLAFVVLPMIGSYLIARNRKAERVDKPLIYRSAYTIATVLISITALGLVVVAGDAPVFTVPVIAFTIAACIFIEYIGSHSKRTFWKGLVRFAAAAVVCASFAALTKSTHGFNMGYKLPKQNEIESVALYNINSAINELPSRTFTDEKIISAVLSEHKKIIDNLDKFDSDTRKGALYKLTITYNLKNGSQVQRSYSPGNPDTKKLVAEFTDNILDLPEIYNMSSLGIINNPNTTCVSVEVYDRVESNYNVISPAAHDEFIRCIRSDLSRPRDYDHVKQPERYIRYNYVDSTGRRQTLHLDIHDSYPDTIAFLNDPDNYSSGISVEIDEDVSVQVSYYAQDVIETFNTDPTLNIRFNSNSEAARELISYFETDYTADGDYSQRFSVTWGDKSLKIKTENEHAALKALIKLIGEQ